MNPFAGSPIPYENIYHMGLVVPSLDRAMAEFADQLGLTWAPERLARVTVRDRAGRVTPCEVRVSYSHQGPPYFELIEAFGDGVWSAAEAGRIHHLGAFVDDVQAERKRLEALGLVTEATAVLPDGTPGGFAYLNNAYGVRVELVSAASRDNIKEWVSS